MREIFSKHWKYGNIILYSVILLCFSLIAYHNLNIGFRMSSDSEAFSRWSDNLISLKFNLYQYYIENTFGNPNFIYTIPIILISFAKLIFGSSWQYSFMIFNLILVFFLFIFFTKILFLLNVRPLVISLSIPLLALSVDLLTWPRFILSDTIFTFIVLLTIYFIIKNFVEEKQNYVSLILLIILLIFTRPTSLPYILSIIFFLSIAKFKIKYNPKLILLFIFSLLFLTPFIFALLYQIMKTYLNSTPQVIYLVEWVESGQIIHDRPETWIKSPSTFFELVYLYFMRILFFFNPYLQSFSKIHNILNSFQSLIVLLSISTWLFLNEKYYTFNKTIALILVTTFFVAAFHAFTLIDYDWRYRFPVIIPLIIIFPISVEIFIIKITKLSKANIST